MEKTWECKICKLEYTDKEKGYGYKCWQNHFLTKIQDDNLKEEEDGKIV